MEEDKKPKSKGKDKKGVMRRAKEAEKVGKKKLLP